MQVYATLSVVISAIIVSQQTAARRTTLAPFVCPVNSRTSGCHCPQLSNKLFCNGTQTGTRLRNALGRISTEVSFTVFEMYGTTIEEMRDYTFTKLRFTDMRVHSNANLQGVQSNAFAGQEDCVERLDLSRNAIATSSVFQAVSKLSKLRELVLSDNKLLEIPYYAFGQQPQLASISLARNRIQVKKFVRNQSFLGLTHFAELN